MELIAVVLNCKSSQERFQAARAMLDYGFANYALVPVWPEEQLGQVPVVLGKEKGLQPEIRGQETLLVDKGKKGEIRRDVSLLPEVSAPVSAGQRLGTLTVRAGDEILAELPLVAPRAVERKSFWDLFRELLGRVSMCPEEIVGNA